MTSRSTPAVLFRIFSRQHALLRQVMRAYFDSITRRTDEKIRLFECDRQRLRQHTASPGRERFAEASLTNIRKLMEELHGVTNQPYAQRFDTTLELASCDPHMVQQVLALNRMSRSH